MYARTLALLSIDSDISSSAFIGTVDRYTAISATFDANGLLVVEIGDLENPSFSFVLTENDGTVALGDDLVAFWLLATALLLSRRVMSR